MAIGASGGAGELGLSKKRIIGLILAVAIIALFSSLPPFEGLDRPAMASIGIFLGAIVMFVCQVAPLAIISLTIMMLLPYFGIMDLTTIYSKFGGTSFFFVMFAFGVTGALSQTTIPLRISAWITRISKGDPRVLVFGFTLAACVISGFLSNFATLIMFYGIVMMFLKVSGCKPGESALGRCLMIGLPMAAGTGGIITPAGSPGNLIAMELISAQGVEITFLQWFLMMSPFAIIACLIIVVLNRINTIGVLKALGATNRSIQLIFVYTTMRIIVRAMLIGNAVAFLFLFLQSRFHIVKLDASSYFMSYVPVEYSHWLIWLNAGIFVISLLSLIIPSFIVSSIQPTKTMKFE